MRYLIGVDIGTSATKTVLIDEEGKIKGQASKEYPMYEPANGWAEQDPVDWKNAVLFTIKKVIEKSRVNTECIKGIGLTGQMHGLVMLDEKNQPLGKSIIWCDQRSGKQVEDMLKLRPEEWWLKITSNPPLAGWTAAKILWMRENHPELFKKCKKILLPKDYIRFILTGEFATDVSDASGMQLLNVKERKWSEEVLNLLDLNENLFGKVYESQNVTGTLLPEIAGYFGLKENVIVVGGASDNAAAAVGTGVVQEGQAFTTVGTSAVVYSHLDHFTEIPEGGLHVCCCAVPGCWHTMGGPQSAGLSMEWFKENFCQDLLVQAKETGVEIHDIINKITEKIPIGSDKLIYLPFLLGERTPHMDADYRGAFIGLSNVHGKGHLLRAIMEGVAYCLADCNDLLKNQGIEIKSMRVCGGGSRSPVWRKIMADLYQCNIHTMKQEEGPAYGAAILAGIGAGIFSDIHSACKKFIKEDKTIEWSHEEAKKYEKYHQIYKKFYFDIKEDLSFLAHLSDIE